MENIKGRRVSPFIPKTFCTCCSCHLHSIEQLLSMLKFVVKRIDSTDRKRREKLKSKKTPQKGTRNSKKSLLLLPPSQFESSLTDRRTELVGLSFFEIAHNFGIVVYDLAVESLPYSVAFLRIKASNTLPFSLREEV